MAVLVVDGDEEITNKKWHEINKVNRDTTCHKLLMLVAASAGKE